MNIHPTAIIHPDVTLGEGARIGPFCVIGSDHGPLTIGANANIRAHSVVYGRSSYGDHLETGHHVVLREGVTAGHGLRVGSYSSIEGPKTHIGNWTHIQGRCEVPRAFLGDFVWLYAGTIITDNRLPPSDRDDPPWIEDGVVTCCNVLVLPGLRLGLGSFIAATATVKKDVPPVTVYERSGRMERLITDLVVGPTAYPWTGRAQGFYPPEAHDDLARLHKTVLGELEAAA